MATVKMHIEYWNNEDYKVFLEKLVSAVEKEVAGVDVVREGGRPGSFEIMINGKLVYSKLRFGCFPKAIDVVRAIREAQSGVEPHVIYPRKQQQQGLQAPNS